MSLESCIAGTSHALSERCELVDAVSVCHSLPSHGSHPTNDTQVAGWHDDDLVGYAAKHKLAKQRTADTSTVSSGRSAQSRSEPRSRPYRGARWHAATLERFRAQQYNDSPMPGQRPEVDGNRLRPTLSGRFNSLNPVRAAVDDEVPGQGLEDAREDPERAG